MATTMVNGGPNVEGNSTVITPNPGKQQQSKSATTGAKGMDSNRKQAGNVSEGAQRYETSLIRCGPHCARNQASESTLCVLVSAS